MKKYLVNQMIVEKIDIDGVVMLSLIRIVFASTKEEAIGKFILATESIKALQKLNIDCYELDTIIKVH